MTKKHFEALAAEIAAIANDDARLIAACAVAKACKRFNPNFDEGRFLRACKAI